MKIKMKTSIIRRIKLASDSFDSDFLPSCYLDDHIVTSLKDHFPITESDFTDSDGQYDHTVLYCFGEAIAKCVIFDRTYRFITWLI